jgi:hypothetical protein
MAEVPVFAGSVSDREVPVNVLVPIVPPVRVQL